VELADHGRLILQGGSLAVFLVLGMIHPRVRGFGLIHRGLILNVLNGFVLFLLASTGVKWVQDHTEFALVDMSFLSAGWMQFLVAFLALDFVRYWVHHAAHRVPWLWTFHRVHHSAEYLDASAGLRMHVVDFFILSAIPITLFGVIMDTANFSSWVVPSALGVGIVFDAFQHANLAMDMTKPWNKAWNLLLNNPHFHSWHHTRDGVLCDGNYSNTIIVWDRLFGTEVTQPVPPEKYGLESSQALVDSVLGWQLLSLREPAAAAVASDGSADA